MEIKLIVVNYENYRNVNLSEENRERVASLLIIQNGITVMLIQLALMFSSAFLLLSFDFSAILNSNTVVNNVNYDYIKFAAKILPKFIAVMFMLWALLTITLLFSALKAKRDWSRSLFSDGISVSWNFFKKIPFDFAKNSKQ